MVYTIAEIRTIEVCNALLGLASIEKRDLDIRKLQQEKQYEELSQTPVGSEAELLGINAEIAGTESIVASLPPGETKDLLESKLIKLRYKKIVLEERSDKYGIIGRMQKQYEISCIEQELLENQSFVDALTRRKGEL